MFLFPSQINIFFLKQFKNKDFRLFKQTSYIKWSCFILGRLASYRIEGDYFFSWHLFIILSSPNLRSITVFQQFSSSKTFLLKELKNFTMLYFTSFQVLSAHTTLNSENRWNLFLLACSLILRPSFTEKVDEHSSLCWGWGSEIKA